MFGINKIENYLEEILKKLVKKSLKLDRPETKTSFIIYKYFNIKNSDAAKNDIIKKYRELSVILDSFGLPIITANVQNGALALFSEYINRNVQIEPISALRKL